MCLNYVISDKYHTVIFKFTQNQELDFISVQNMLIKITKFISLENELKANSVYKQGNKCYKCSITNCTHARTHASTHFWKILALQHTIVDRLCQYLKSSLDVKRSTACQKLLHRNAQTISSENMIDESTSSENTSIVSCRLCADSHK